MMRIRSTAGAILGAVILAMGAVPAGATTVDHTSFHGFGADAIFRSVEAGQVLDVDVSLVTGTGVPHGVPPALLEQYPLPVLAVTIISSDEVTGEESMNAVGVKSLAPVEFTLDQATLSSASVDAAVELSDSVNGTDFTVDIDVEWSAWGRYSTSRGGWVLPSEQVVRVTEKVREYMSAEGSVIPEGGDNLVPDPTDAGYMMKTHQSSVTITQ